MTSGEVHEGGCLSGDVRYAVSGPSVWSAICCCQSCTKASGGIAVAWAGIEKARFRLLKGSLGLFESTPGFGEDFAPVAAQALPIRRIRKQ
jgi:hypothetical protein